MAAWTLSSRLAFVFVFVSTCACLSPVDKVCPPNWVQNRASCYSVLNVSLAWPEANKHCLDIGGLLVVIESAEENAFVTAMLRSQSLVKRKVWLGCNDRAVEGQGDTTKPMEFAEWAQPGAQPNNKNNQDCASLYFPDNNDHGWYDHNCDNKLLPSVCERRAAPRGSKEDRGVTIKNSDLKCTALDSTGHPII